MNLAQKLETRRADDHKRASLLRGEGQEDGGASDTSVARRRKNRTLAKSDHNQDGTLSVTDLLQAGRENEPHPEVPGKRGRSKSAEFDGKNKRKNNISPGSPHHGTKGYLQIEVC